MKTTLPPISADVVMLGTFGVWTRGTLQSRALPLARSIAAQTDLRVAIVTTPWDDPGAAGRIERCDGVTIFNTANIHPNKAPLAIIEQVRLLRQLKPKLLHVIKPKGFGGLAAQLRAALPVRTRLVVDCDDWEGDGGWNCAGDYDVLSRRLFAFQENQLIRSAHHVTAASTLLEERARRARGTSRANDVTFLPNGLDHDWIERLRHAAITRSASESGPSVLVYSRFAEFSSAWLQTFIAQLDQLVEEPTTVDFVGNLEDGALERSSFRNLMLRFHGYVDRQQLPRVLASGTVALFPYEDNLINRSKQSVKLLELMASGRPIVACDVGDIARIAGDAIVMSSSPQAHTVADCVDGLLRDSPRRRQLGVRAMERAANFSVDRGTRTLLDVYRRAGLIGV